MDRANWSAVAGPACIAWSVENRAQAITFDKEIYKWRHPIEHFFARIKEFRRIATRYDKTDTSYAGMIYLTSAALALR